MKKILALLLLLAAVAGCAAGKGPAALLHREELLSDARVNELAGSPMRLVCDSIDEKNGFACWAWEESEGLPKLLVLEFRFPPQDCDGLYEDALQGAAPAPMPEGVSACYDDRAVHLRVGSFYVKIASMGIQNEKDALNRLAVELAGAFGAAQ